MERKIGEYLISTDKSLLCVDTIYKYLHEESYWAKDRSLDKIKLSIENSLCFGVYKDGKQIGFARAVTDYVTSYHLCDVFILKEYRGQGLGKLLVETIVNYDKLQGVKGTLFTGDAHGLYSKFGFECKEDVATKFMMRVI